MSSCVHKCSNDKIWEKYVTKRNMKNLCKEVCDADCIPLGLV